MLPETFCQKKRSYSKITEKRTFYPKITEKRTFWPKKTEKERNSGAQKNGVRSLERVLATLSGTFGWLFWLSSVSSPAQRGERARSAIPSAGTTVRKSTEPACLILF